MGTTTKTWLGSEEYVLYSLFCSFLSFPFFLVIAFLVLFFLPFWKTFQKTKLTTVSLMHSVLITNAVLMATTTRVWLWSRVCQACISLCSFSQFPPLVEIMVLCRRPYCFIHSLMRLVSHLTPKVAHRNKYK